MVDRVQRYEDELGSQVDQLREQALDFAAVARERLDEASQTLKNYVVEHPAKALGFALGLGVALGWLVKRR